MSRRTKIRLADVNISQKLSSYFGEVFNLLDKRISGATRKGIYKAINSIAARARSNVMSSWFKSTKPTRNGAPLIYGIRAHMFDTDFNKAAGRVHILGDTRVNDGTWMLRFFSDAGTKQRGLKQGHNKGRIRGDRWFVNAIQGADNLAVQNVQQSIDEMIKKNFN